MPAQPLVGGELAASMLRPLAERARDKLDRPPTLVAIRANDDPGTLWYAKAQAKHCREHGVEHRLVSLDPATATAATVRAAIAEANADPAVDGVILFSPLPAGVAAGPLVAAIAPEKDAEGVHPVNLGRLLLEGFDWNAGLDPDAAIRGRAGAPVPCTAAAAVALIRGVWPSLAKRRALVVGRSAIVGKPAALLLLGLDATVTVGHTRTQDLAALARDSDVLLAAAGAAGVAWRRYRPLWETARESGAEPPPAPDLSPLVKEDWIRRGAVVVDVGENEVPAARDAANGLPVAEADGTIRLKRIGDVERRGVEDIAGWLTPEKGGVGPLTNAFLLRNVFARALKRV